MNKNQFSVGQLVKVDGRIGKFRYVGKNIVREIKSGKCYSVSYSKMKSAKKMDLNDASVIMIKIFVFFIYPLFVLYLLFSH